MADACLNLIAEPLSLLVVQMPISALSRRLLRRITTIHGQGIMACAGFASLGATNVELLLLLDKASANDASIADSLRQSRLIYMLGGFTGYLGETVKGSESERAMRDAYEAGAVIAGSSAGAMVMCQYYFNPGSGQVVEGLNFVPNTCVLPHHNTFGKKWASQLTRLLPNAVLLGIDEQTGMLDERW